MSFTCCQAFVPSCDSSGGGGGPPTPSTNQVFRYVATGAEGTQFTVALPALRASANYNVQITQGGPLANVFKTPRALVSTFTNTDFDVELAAAAEAGDILMFTVEDLT